MSFFSASKSSKKGDLEDEIRTINLASDALEQLRNSGEMCDNSVKTSKYTWWSFIPVNLWVQFRTKAANVYFLVIMFM